MSDFIRSNQKLDDAILGADNFESMRERMLQTLAQQGVISRDRTDAYGVRVNPDSPALARPDVPLSEKHGTPTHIRKFYGGADGNSEFVITGMSDADLDLQEEKIRQQDRKKN